MLFRSINIRAFDVIVGTTHVPGVAGSEVLSALVKAVRVKPRRTLPPRFRPPTRLPSQFRQSLTQDRFWQRMQILWRRGGRSLLPFRFRVHQHLGEI